MFAVFEVFEGEQSFAHQFMGAVALDVRDEADAACVVFAIGVIHAFRREAERSPGEFWIVKPAASACGRGIFVTGDAEEAASSAQDGNIFAGGAFAQRTTLGHRLGAGAIVRSGMEIGHERSWLKRGAIRQHEA